MTARPEYYLGLDESLKNFSAAAITALRREGSREVLLHSLRPGLVVEISPLFLITRLPFSRAIIKTAVAIPSGFMFLPPIFDYALY